MKARGPASTMNVADQLTVLSRTQIERRGRWRSFRRSLSAVIGMIVILTPLYLTCAAVLPTVADMPSSVPARIVLLLEVALIRVLLPVRLAVPGTGELRAGASGLPQTGLDHGRPGGHRRRARPDRERDRLDAGRRRPGLSGLPHRHRVAVLAAHRRRRRRAAGLRRAGCGQQRRSVVAAERRDVRAAVGPEQVAATLGRPGPRVLAASVDPTLAGHPGRRLRPGARTRTRRHGDLLLRWRHPLGIVLSRRPPGAGAARRLSRRQGRRGGQWRRLHRRRAACPALALQGQPGRRLVAAESGGLRTDERGGALAAAPHPLSVRLTQAGHARRPGHRVRHDGQPLLVRPGPRCAGVVARLVAQRLRRTGRLEQPRGGRG